MKDIFKLFINGNLVNFEQEPSFPVTYQQEDFSNPTAIKNSFSKTIKIEGTDNNNKIFGEIYNLDREQLYKFKNFGGAYFDPSKRTPFELYKNSELLESGYMQLSDITLNNNQIVYNITLYGGLGDFFYSLMYNEDGEKKTLADLYYKIEDYNGNIRDKETELEFNINKDFVKQSWDALKNGDEDNYIHNFITFAPAYNGLNQDFANNTFCINTHNSELFNKDNSITEDEVTYTTYNGYKLAKTEKEFTEWDIRDLRSYLQRPVLKFKKLFGAICDEYNNGGYKVNLDKSFFNNNNPYYNDAYVALPLLPNIEAVEADNRSYTLYNNYFNLVSRKEYCCLGLWEYPLTPSSRYNSSLFYKLAFDGDDRLSAVKKTDYIIDMSQIPATSTFDVDIDFSLNFIATFLDETANNENLYTSEIRTRTDLKPDNYYYRTLIKFSYVVQAVLYDIDNPDEEYYSQVLNFTTNLIDGKFNYVNDLWRFKKNFKNADKYNYVNVLGCFKRQGNTNNYKWVTYEDGVSNFYLSIKNAPRKERMALAIRFVKDGDSNKEINANGIYGISQPVNKQFVDINWLYLDKEQTIKYEEQELVFGYCELSQLFETSTITWKPNTPSVKSNSVITKNMLLKTEFSPCDILLNYCKLFGLYFKKDIHSKTIDIITKNNFFKNEVIDINKRIDYSNQIQIKPYLFETKYYLMKNEENETYYSKKYSNEYNVIYGQKRINTNYNFNQETKNVYDGSVFQNAISATDSSNYFRTFFNNDNKIVPCFLFDNPKFELYNNIGGEDVDIFEQEQVYKDWFNLNKTVNWNLKGGYDMFAKTCFYTFDNNNKSLSDINSTLLFFNGFHALKDVANNDVPFWLSDDVSAMNILNDGEMCYLITENEVDKNGFNIATKCDELPQFTRYFYNANNVTDSFDFGLPKETYILNINYEEDATLYNKFWKKYLTDRYNINTKKVTCYVNLEGLQINQETLRKFYHFNNCIWVMNKIENYFPNQYKTTKIEFVKVNDIDNYINSQFQYEYNAIELNEDKVTVDFNTTTYSFELTSTNSWSASTDSANTITPISGDFGTYKIEITTTPNEKTYDVSKFFKFESVAGDEVTFELVQLPSPNLARMFKGYVYSEQLNYVVSSGEIYIKNKDDETYTQAMSIDINESGYFEGFITSNLFTDNKTYVNVSDSNGDVLIENVVVDWDELIYNKENDIIIS